MPDAICTQCGSTKGAPLTPCPACGFDPRGDALAEVKSIYLSVVRIEDNQEAAKYGAELARIAEQVRAGQAVHYDQDVLDRLLVERKVLQEVT